MNTILHNYGALLSSVDRWFDRCMSVAQSEIRCASGCSECCRGLFDITLLDAWYLKTGFDRLDGEVRKTVLRKAGNRLDQLREVWKDFEEPFILNVRREEEWEELMPDEDEIPCPLLSESGQCLVYEYRPMTCRLHGVPLVDVSGEVFHDEWCTLNFKEEDPMRMKGLEWSFSDCFQTEMALFQQFTHKLFNRCINELDTFIPMALFMDYEKFDWNGWLVGKFRVAEPQGFPESR